MIIEPILSEGGDLHASPSFFRKLRELTSKRGVFFICDEVQTGAGATGTFWAHEKWQLAEHGLSPPDFVTFSKKLQASGFFHKLETRPSTSYRQFNTWLGEPIKALQAREMIKVIKRDNLLQNTVKVGEYVYNKLEQLQTSGTGHGKISNLRGKGCVMLFHVGDEPAENVWVRRQGTFIAFDFDSTAQRDAFLKSMRQKGVNMGGCGDRCEQHVTMWPKADLLGQLSGFDLCSSSSAVMLISCCVKLMRYLGRCSRLLWRASARQNYRSIANAGCY